MNNDRVGGGWAPPPPHAPVRQLFQAELPAGVPSAPQPARRARRRRRYLLAAAVCAVLAVLLGFGAAARYRDDHAPRTTVKRYFAALARGDAPAALALAASAPRSDYLTSAVLKQQLAVAKFHDVVVGATAVHGNRATTQVSYQLVFSSGTKHVVDAVELVKQGSSWRLSRVATSINLSGGDGTLNRLSFAGRPMPSGHLVLFPGALPVATGNPAVQPDGQPMIRYIDDNRDTSLSVSVSAEAKKTLAASLHKALDGCLGGTSKDLNCPLPDQSRPIPGSLRGTENVGHSDVPTIALSSTADGRVDLTVNVAVSGSWKVWDFNNQAVSRSGETEVRVQAAASISDLNAIYWVSAP